MTDALHLTPREVAQVEAALDEPTPIDPADIRPGDVVERRLSERMTALGRMTTPENDEKALIPTSRGAVFAEFGGYTWYLVERPDPDWEIEDLIGRDGLAALHEHGWDVVRRAES